MDAEPLSSEIEEPTSTGERASGIDEDDGNVGAMSGSVYQRVLGDEFSSLDARLQTYFGPIPRGWVGRGSGVYSIAGSRVRILVPVLALMARRHVLFPDYGRDVPFTIVNTPGADGTLSAVRTFDFARRTRVMEDTMSVLNGRLHDRLGKRRGLDVAIRLSVADGALQMSSTGVSFRTGGLRLPLPPVVRMHLSERTVSESEQRVDVRIVAPLLGEIFRYTGTFTYALEPINGDAGSG